MTDAFTSLYCVIGNPVRHSKSPLIHNTWFQTCGINAVYLAFELSDIQSAVNTFRHFNIKGISVTLPFKSAVMPFLDELDRDAEKIGAVNTIVNTDGSLKGYNTDCNAAVTPLTRLTDVAQKKVGIIGAGGAAQAVAYGLWLQKADLIIINRDIRKAQCLAETLNAEWAGLEDIDAIRGLKMDVLINTTPVGMVPDIDALPVPDTVFNPDMIVMDIVYTPLQTKLLQQAKARGCRTIDGLSMFIHQGAAQFELWTGIHPDTSLIRKLLINGEQL